MGFLDVMKGIGKGAIKGGAAGGPAGAIAGAIGGGLKSGVKSNVPHDLKTGPVAANQMAQTQHQQQYPGFAGQLGANIMAGQGPGRALIGAALAKRKPPTP